VLKNGAPRPASPVMQQKFLFAGQASTLIQHRLAT
jgi:hypothetical protein